MFLQGRCSVPRRAVGSLLAGVEEEFQLASSTLRDGTAWLQAGGCVGSRRGVRGFVCGSWTVWGFGFLRGEGGGREWGRGRGGSKMGVAGVKAGEVGTGDGV